MLLAVTSNLIAQKKILIVSTNRDSVGNNRSGTYLMEIAYPIKHFTDQGFEVDVLTPKGGQTAIYDKATTPEDLVQIRDSELFISKINHSLSPSEVKAKEYVAVFFPRGHGQYFDVVNDERIASITAHIYENGGVVSSAGHGVASLINVQLRNGDYLVKDKSITCFPTWAEQRYMTISNYGKLLAFDMQEVLSRRGAKLITSTYETSSKRELTHVVDAPNGFVTGAFASSAQWVAEETVKLVRKKK